MYRFQRTYTALYIKCHILRSKSDRHKNKLKMYYSNKRPTNPLHMFSKQKGWNCALIWQYLYIEWKRMCKNKLLVFLSINHHVMYNCELLWMHRDVFVYFRYAVLTLCFSDINAMYQLFSPHHLMDKNYLYI